MNSIRARLRLICEKYEKIKNPSVLTALVLISCYFSFHTLQNQIGIVSRLIFYVLAYVGAQNISDVICGISKIYNRFFDKVVLFIICMLATFCETGAYYIEPIYTNPVPVIPFFLMSALWMSVIVLYLIFKGYCWIEKKTLYEGKGFSIKTNIVMVAVCVLLCMLCDYAFNPAITSPDSQYCYSYAFHLGEGPISDGHPVFYIMLLKLCTLITSKIQFMILVQAVFYAVIFTYAMNVLAQIGVSKKICVVLFCLVGIGFNAIILITTLWKDIPFTVSLLWLTVLLVKMCINQEKCSKNIWWYVQYAVASVFTSLIRHNGLLPVIVTLILTLILLKNKKRIIITTLIASLTIIVIKGPIYSHYQVEEDPGLKFYAMANDIMYLYHHGGSDDVIMQVVNDVTDGDPENFSYSPYYTSVTRANMNHYSVSEFLKIYLHAWTAHPKTMLKGFLARNTVVWSIDKTVKEVGTCVKYLDEYRDESYLENYPERVPNFLTDKLTKLFTGLTNNHFIYTLYWKTSIYNLLMVIGVMLIIVRFKKRFALFTLPFIPIAVNVFALLISSGWPDYRYYWPSMLAATILIPYTLILLAKGEK